MVMDKELPHRTRTHPSVWLTFILGFWLILLLNAGCQDTPPTAPSNSILPESTSLVPTGETMQAALVDELPINYRTFEMGTAGFIPRNYPDASDKDWSDFLNVGASSYGETFGVHVNPGDQPNEDSIPQQVQLAFEHMQGVKVYVAFAVNHERGPFTEERADELKRAAVATAETYQPQVLSLGVESNSLYLFQRETYPLYLETVRDIYDEIKAVSPKTQVMNNFQLDRMRGKTSLSGEDFDPHWDLISQLEGKIDLVSFTVYPHLEYRNPGEIPDQYLQEIREHTDLPVMITETGWPTEDTASGAQGSDQLQIEYMFKLFQQANKIDLEALVWVFPHDASFGLAGGIFDHISLRHNDGGPKPGFDYWQAALTLPHK